MPLPDRYNFTDFIPEIGRMDVEIRTRERPNNVIFLPDNATVPWYWRDGKLTATIPKLQIHGVLVIE